MIEVEVKLRVGNHKALEEQLKLLGAVFKGEEHQWDIYFNAPHRDFFQTGEALRLRQEDQKPEATLTYKGPPVYSAGSKAREEIESHIESPVENLQKHRAILEALGFRSIAEIKKKRRCYLLDGIPVYLDEVEGLGSFIEVGTVVRDEEVSAMKKKIFSLMERLGFKQEQIVPETYLELLLAA
jgi:adenylate cyclase class 2